jgi:subtilisin family serine protease
VKKLFLLNIVFTLVVFAQPRVINKGNIYYLSNTVIIKIIEGNPENILQSKVVQQLLPEKFEKVFFNKSSALYKSANTLNNIYNLDYFSNEDPYEVANKVKKIPGIIWAEPRYVRKVVYTPNDPRYTSNEQKNLERIYAKDAWNITKGDSNIVIAIVDTGVDWKHPDLASNIFINRKEIANNGLDEDDGGIYPDDINGWDFGGLNGTEDNDPAEDPSRTGYSYHGTHVAGIAGAVTNNGIGIASIGFNCRILPVKVSRSDVRDSNDNPYVVYGFEGITYAAEKGAKVINCSWGGYTYSNFEQDVINYATAKGSLVVAAAGNDASEELFYPASYDGVLSVGWLNTDDDTKSFAGNYGFGVDVMSPGTAILSTWRGDAINNNRLYNVINGSSMAAPLAAGLAGLVSAKFPNYTPLQIAEQIRITADNVDAQNTGYEMLLGRGRINAYRALTETGSPSVRASNIRLTEIGNGNGIYQSGESVEVAADFTNYLAAASNLNITLTTDDPWINITQGSLNVSLSTLQSTNSKFRFTIKTGAPIDRTIIFVIRFNSAGYSDAQLFSIKINIPLETHTTSKIAMSVTSKGALGYNDYSRNKEGVGFRFMNGRNLMFEGAFMYGVSSSMVMDAARISDKQSSDFKRVVPITLKSPGTHAFQETYSNFDDSGVSPRLGISTHFYTYSYNTPEDENYIILRAALNNSTQETIGNLYAGFFIDWDIPDSDYSNNTVRYDAADNFAYAYNTNTLDVYVGTALLYHNNYGFYPIKNDALEGEVRLFDNNGFTDIEKFITLSSGIYNAAPFIGDISYVVSGGPFTVNSGQTQNIAFAIAAASTLDELRNAVKRSRVKYLSIPTSINSSTEVIPDAIVLYQNYPNPFNPETVIRYQLPVADFVTLKVYNILGNEIATLVNEFQNAGIYNSKFSILNSQLSSGVYFYKLSVGKIIKSGKMIMIK